MLSVNESLGVLIAMIVLFMILLRGSFRPEFSAFCCISFGLGFGHWYLEHWNLFGDWILEFGILPVSPMGGNAWHWTTCYFAITGCRIYGMGIRGLLSDNMM